MALAALAALVGLLAERGPLAYTGSELWSLAETSRRSSIDWPVPVSMGRTLTRVRTDSRTMWGMMMKTISVLSLILSREVKKYLRMGISPTPGVPLMLRE